MEKAIFEGVSINNSPSTPGHLMSSKTEYKQGQAARVVLVREPGGGRRLPGVRYHTSGNGGGLLRLSRVVTFSEEDGEEEQPLAPDPATFSSSGPGDKMTNL